MNRRKAIAEIRIDPQKGWLLPTFGNKRPHRYWSHAHFEGDPTWETKIWTLIVDLDAPPDIRAGTVSATIYFMAEDAPQHLIKENAAFELSCENNIYTSGIVKRVL